MPDATAQTVEPDDASLAIRLAKYFRALTALTAGLIVLGALVRAHGAGLACPDWPLCFGELLPAFDLKVRFEWTHRLVAGSVSLLFLALSIATLRRPALRRELAPLLLLGALILGVQVLLGALTVWQLLASWTVTAHLLTGNSFCVVLLLTSQRLGDLASPRTARTPVPAGLRLLLVGTASLLVLQVALGGLVASTFVGLVCPEWPTCTDGVWFPTFEGAVGLQLIHRLCAYALLAGLAACAVLGRNVPGLGRLLWGSLALGLAQLAVGVANVLLRLPVEVTGLHSALAAALVLMLALALRETWRRASATGTK